MLFILDSCPPGLFFVQDESPMETAMEDDTAPKMETEVKVKFEIPEKKVEPEKTVLQVVEGFKTVSKTR